MERVPEDKIEDIQLQKVLLKTKHFNTFKRKFQSSVSNALVISIFKAKFPPKAFLSRIFIALEARHKQSLIILPLMKPF